MREFVGFGWFYDFAVYTSDTFNAWSVFFASGIYVQSCRTQRAFKFQLDEQLFFCFRRLEEHIQWRLFFFSLFFGPAVYQFGIDTYRYRAEYSPSILHFT